MSKQLFLGRTSWGPEAFRGVVNDPHDRTEPVRRAFAEYDIELLEIFYSPNNGEVITLFKAELKEISAYTMAARATGSFLGSTIEPLLDMSEMLVSMNMAKERSHTFKPPSQDEIDRMLLEE